MANDGLVELRDEIVAAAQASAVEDFEIPMTEADLHEYDEWLHANGEWILEPAARFHPRFAFVETASKRIVKVSGFAHDDGTSIVYLAIVYPFDGGTAVDVEQGALVRATKSDVLAAWQRAQVEPGSFVASPGADKYYGEA